MACIISLIDPTKNKVKKTLHINESYLVCENRVILLNNKLNSNPNPKELFWSVTTINI